MCYEVQITLPTTDTKHKPSLHKLFAWDQRDSTWDVTHDYSGVYV